MSAQLNVYCIAILNPRSASQTVCTPPLNQHLIRPLRETEHFQKSCVVSVLLLRGGFAQLQASKPPSSREDAVTPQLKFKYSITMATALLPPPPTQLSPPDAHKHTANGGEKVKVKHNISEAQLNYQSFDADYCKIHFIAQISV